MKSKLSKHCHQCCHVHYEAESCTDLAFHIVMKAHLVVLDDLTEAGIALTDPPVELGNAHGYLSIATTHHQLGYC